MVTQSISGTIFCINDLNYRFYDVSGLKYYRMKWANYFDFFDAVLFVSDISSYNQSLIEDAFVNRIKDACGGLLRLLLSGL
jgi:hypothetical protein